MTGGTRVLSDRIIVRISQEPGESFLDRMIALVEGAKRQKTPNELALNLLLVALTFIFLMAHGHPAAHGDLRQGRHGRRSTTPWRSPTAVSRSSSWSRCWSALIPTTIGALLSAIGIAGMDRHGPAKRARHVRPRGRGGG